MDYIAKELAPGEEVTFRTRMHPVALAGTGFFALFVVGVVVLIVIRNELDARTIALLCLGGVATVIVGSFTALLRWRTTELAVTPRRLLVRSRRRAVDSFEARSLGSVDVGETWLGRRLDYGTVAIADAQGPLASFRAVHHARALHDALVRQLPQRTRSRAR